MMEDRKVEYAHEASPETVEAIANAKPSPEAHALNYLLDTPTGESLPPTSPDTIILTQQVVTNTTTLDEVDPDSTSNPPAIRPSGATTVTQALHAELQEHARLALEYQNLINTAKTDAKKSYYKKKLTKNNENALKILVALDRVSKAQTAKRKNVQPKQDK